MGSECVCWLGGTFSGLLWVIRLGDFSQGEEKGKKLNDMRKNEREEEEEKACVVPTGLRAWPLVCMRACT